MPEFEVPIGKANVLRSLIASKEGTLLPPKGPAALSSPDQTIQVLKGEPVVVTFSRYQSTDGKITPMMNIVTSKGIAKQKWFAQIISGDSPVDDWLEPLRKRMHKVDDERRRALNRALDKAATYPNLKQ